MLSFPLAILIAVQTAAVQGPPPRPSPPPVPGNEIHGVVLRPDGKPAPFAKVGAIALFAVGQAPQPPFIVTADDQGAFRLETKGIKEFGVRAQLRPFASTAAPRVSAGQRITLKLETGVAVEGEVLDAATSKPIAGALVEAADWDVSPYAEIDPDFAMARAKTDAKGHFTLTGVSGGGRPLVRVAARGFGSEQATVTAGGPMKFRLSPGHDLRGVIVDGADRPVAKARITLRGSASTLSGTSNTAGRFEIAGLKPISYDAMILAAGFAPFVKSGIDPEATSLRITLDKASSVSGRMVDEEGKPLKGVVRLRSHDGVALPPSFLQGAMASVGEDGKFAIDAVRPGSNVIQLAGVGYTAIQRTIEIAHAGEAVSLGDVEFDAGLTIRGRVVEAGDIGLAGARVTAVLPGDTQGADPLFAEADAEGRFLLRGLKEDAYMVAMMAEGFAPLQLRLTASADEQVFTMKRAITLTGRIVDPDGVPIGRVQIAAQRGDDRRTSRGARSGADGRFTLDLSDPGDFTLITAVEGFEGSFRTVPVAGPADVGDWTLSRGLRVRGVVIDGKGSPIQGARVENQSTRQFPMTFAETDEKGAFELRGASPGLIRLVASHRDHAAARATVEAPVDAERDPDPVRITLTKGGRIEGVVRERNGSAVAQARIELYRLDALSTPRVSNALQDSAVTSADGSFSFANLPPGSGRVTLMSGQGGRYTSVTSAEVNILEGETTQVALTLRSTVVRGVLRINGKPGAGLRVTVFEDYAGTSSGSVTSASLASDIPWSMATADAEGSFALRVAGPMKGRANVSSVRGDSLYSQQVEIPDVEQFQLNLDFGSVQAVGRVIDSATGLGIAEARVSARTSATEAGAARQIQPTTLTNHAGVFELTLEPGDFEISVTAEDYSAVALPFTISPSGVSLGDIGLEHGGTLLGRVVFPSGRPAAGAQVRGMRAGTSSFAMSRPDGSFTLRGLPKGPLTILVSDALDNMAVVRVDEIPADVIEIRLTQAAQITAVVAGDAAATVGATVAVSKVDGEPYWGSRAFRTDPRGVATLVAPKGLLTLIARSATHEGTLVVPASAGETLNVTIELAPRKAAIPK